MNVIKTGHTYFELSADPATSEGKMIRLFIKQKLADFVYDYRWKRWIRANTYIAFDEKKKLLRMPINFLQDFISFIDGCDFPPYEIKKISDYRPREVTFMMREDFNLRPDQEKAVEFLINDSMDRKGLSLETGGGKTCTAITAMERYSVCTIIIVSRLVQQWMDEIDHFTMNRDDIYMIKGIASLKRILKSDYQPNVFVCSLETIRSYVRNKGEYKKIISYEKFLKHYGVGLKIMDEVHLNFATCTDIDLHSNVKNNIYLTATFDQTKRGTKKIFQKIYPFDILYLDGSSKYINIYVYGYASGVPPKRCQTVRGYSHSRFEAGIFTRITKLKRFVHEYLSTVIRNHYITRRDPEEKCLIFFNTLQMIFAVKELLEIDFPDETILTYTAEDPKENLEGSSKIILSTHKSCGVGTDIRNLRTCIDTISLASAVMTRQVVGRLRKLPNGNTPEFISMYDPSIPSHCRHLEERRHVYRSKTDNLTEIIL